MADWDPEATLRQGASILTPALQPLGFRFDVVQVDESSGGPFAVWVFDRGDRSIELHVRSALGIVMYRVGDASLEHRAFMDELGVVDRAYPGFSDDPLDGFRHLLEDLRKHGESFLDGSGDGGFLVWASRHELGEQLRRLP